MRVLDRLLPSPATVAFALNPTAPVAVAATSAPTRPALRMAPIGRGLDFQLERISRSVAMSIPAFRRGVHVLSTIATFGLAAWTADGTRLPPTDPRTAWLRQPDPAKTLFTTLKGTVDDAIWHDRSTWMVLDRYATGMPAKMRRIQPDRVSRVPDPVDPDLFDTVVIDGQAVDPAKVVTFDFAGIGGLDRYGFEILDLYAALQSAAARYAKAPHPKAILKNHGADLLDDEIDALLELWEAQRETRSVGYLNDVVDYETFGWNAQELQLTEAREYAALEVARLLGLPARALDAPTGDSMTYANVVDARQDLLEAFRPYMTPIEQTLSLNDRRSIPQGVVVPAGIDIRFDADAYLRDNPSTRFATWASAVASGVLTLSEVRALEPFASTSAAPSAPTPGVAP